jgi:CBS-domain-containing membrane protein
MNIAFFITPKKDSVYLAYDSTMRQALEKMEYHRYTAIPLIDKEGRYVCTLTEGDLLWKLKNTPDLTFKDTNKICLKDVPTHMTNKALSINASLKEVLHLLVDQNFVPIVDDDQVFVGIVKRSTIMNYLFNKYGFDFEED